MTKQLIKPKPKFVALSFNTTTMFLISQIPDTVLSYSDLKFKLANVRFIHTALQEKPKTTELSRKMKILQRESLSMLKSTC
jgi:hypothetical protein